MKYYIEVEDKPLYFYIEAGKINEEAGYELIPDISPDTKVKVYVFDVRFQKKPFGGWGDLYIMDYPTKDYVDKVVSPYEDGMLYQTGAQAYTYYGGDNVLLVGADVTGVDEQDIERIKAYAAEHLQPAWVPVKIHIVI